MGLWGFRTQKRPPFSALLSSKKLEVSEFSKRAKPGGRPRRSLAGPLFLGLEGGAVAQLRASLSSRRICPEAGRSPRRIRSALGWSFLLVQMSCLWSTCVQESLPLTFSRTQLQQFCGATPSSLGPPLASAPAPLI